MVVDLPCFSVVRPLTSWYTSLPLFFSEACFYFLALTLYPSLFCHLHLCPDLSFNLPIVFGSFLLFFRSRLWSQRSRISGVTQGFPFRRCLPRSSAAESVTALLKWVTMESRSASSSTSVGRGANLLSIVACKAFKTVGSFSFSRSNLILGLVGFLEILRRVWKVIITMSWSFPTSAPGNVLAVLIPDRNRFFTKM